VDQSARKPRLIAVDTNFLLDYANNLEIISDCISTIRKRVQNSQLVILPTTVQELGFLAMRGGDEQTKNLAWKAATSLLSWNIQPLNCVPVGHAIVEQIALKLRQKGVIPEAEVNDSLTVAEAGLAGVTLLISNDSHIKDIDVRMLQLELDASDVSTPLIASPWKIVSGFFR
jgi:hypothetical protein